jgi:riboflavin synthase
MFTGIIKEVGEVAAIRDAGTNRTFTMRAAMASEVRVDESVAHNGVCLTIESIGAGTYEATAVKETLERTAIGSWRIGDAVNLERSLRLGDRLDGHMVQGHVDATVECIGITDEGGSWSFRFALPPMPELLVHKGSICIDGVSLTVAQLDAQGFGVAIIPYTYAHTAFRALRIGQRVNVEYDVLGKYVQRLLAAR